MDDRTIVQALLRMHGLTPGADLEALVAGYALSRMRMARLWDMPGVRDAEPAVTFDARS